VAELLEGELPDIAHVVTTEMGKPFAQAKGEVAKCASGFRWFAEHAEAMLADEEVAVDASLGSGHLPTPGAVLAIMPWNFPLWQVTRFLAPALMAGNVGLLKHAPSVPRTALLLEDLLRRAGAPERRLPDAAGRHRPGAGHHRRPRVAAVTLTGSVGAGRAVAAQAGAVGKKIVLELGGSDPFIVLPSADVERAAEVGVQARVQNAGQSCIAAKRFIVHRQVADAFVERLRRRHGGLVRGRPLRPGHRGRAPGHRAGPGHHRGPGGGRPQPTGPPSLCGGERVVGPGGPDRPGFFYRPTVITDITPAMRVATEEVFGPVALLYRGRRRRRGAEPGQRDRVRPGRRACGPDPDEQQRFVNGAGGRPGLRQRHGRLHARAALRGDQELGHRSGAGRGHGLHEFCNVKSVWIA
jgi:succinate-semialdehyde dehydrogenase/glutarate-semialdehyde dehydrogenase